MNKTRTNFVPIQAWFARLVVLAAGLGCLLCFPGDMPVVAGRLGCLAVGVRIWVVGLALLAAAAVWVPYHGSDPHLPV